MKKHTQIQVNGLMIRVDTKGTDDYISLTDMARFKDNLATGIVIAHWLSTKYTIQFIGAWELLHNPVFNVTEFSNIKNEAGSHGYIISSSKWVGLTNAIGIRSISGRYGGTYAHRDIAFEFATWLSPEFKLYLIKEFQRLKEDENQRLALGWDVRRQLTNINYRIHTEAIKENLIPQALSTHQATSIYASEADVLNMALFGLTAKVWREQHQEEDGNLRDYADVTQLVVLANLESINAEYIRQGISQSERLLALNAIAISQMKSLTSSPSLKKLKERIKE